MHLLVSFHFVSFILPSHVGLSLKNEIVKMQYSHHYVPLFPLCAQSGMQLKLLQGITNAILLTDIESPFSDFAVLEKKDVSKPSIVKVQKCYVPPAPTPRVQITEEDFGNCSVTSDSSGSTGLEKDDNTDEKKINIRASPIPRPRAVISSPYNDMMIGSRNRNTDGTRSALKNGAVQQNRHSHCNVKSRDITDGPQDTRKSKEPGSNDKTDTVGKIKVKKGCIKSENVHRVWRF